MWIYRSGISCHMLIVINNNDNIRYDGDGADCERPMSADNVVNNVI